MTPDVRLVSAPQRLTAVVAAQTTWPEFPRLWKTLLDQVYVFLATSEVRQTGHNVMLFRDDVPHVEVGVEVSTAFTSGGPVVSSTLPSGAAAMTVHRGPYDRLRQAHVAVLQWCAANGCRPTGQRWEVYGDWHEDPEQLETEVYYQLASAEATCTA